MLVTENSSSAFNFKSQIVEDWNGGYKLETELEAKVDVDGWSVELSLPYEIRAAYGVDIIDQGHGKYTITGQNEQVDLQEGQSINPIFIVDDNRKKALLPEYISCELGTSVDTVAHTSKTSINTNTSKTTKDEPNIINVDRDFEGDLEDAIATAKDGDIVKLGKNTYYTDGITLEKDITIDGQKGTVIDGEGTSEAIFQVTASASGASIRDLEITNGNNGIVANGASNLTLQNLIISHIGLDETIRTGHNNTGIVLNQVEGVKLLNSEIHDIGRKAVGLENTDGGVIRGLTVYNVNLEAQHAHSHDAAGIKLFNTNDIKVKDNYLSDINAIHIWNDTTKGTTIDNNVLENIGEDFLAPAFNNNVDLFGIYDEKSVNSVIENNETESVGRFFGFKATEYTMETITLEDNDFDRYELGTTDYWVNESAEKLIAITEDPDKANFSLIAKEYAAHAVIGE